MNCDDDYWPSIFTFYSIVKQILIVFYVLFVNQEILSINLTNVTREGFDIFIDLFKHNLMPRMPSFNVSLYKHVKCPFLSILLCVTVQVEVWSGKDLNLILEGENKWALV